MDAIFRLAAYLSQWGYQWPAGVDPFKDSARAPLATTLFNARSASDGQRQRAQHGVTKSVLVQHVDLLLGWATWLLQVRGCSGWCGCWLRPACVRVRCSRHVF